MPLLDELTGEALQRAWKVLLVWGDITPILNFFLLVFVLLGLIALNARLRK